MAVVCDSRFLGPDGQTYLWVDGPNLWLNFLEDYLEAIEAHLEIESVFVQDRYQEFRKQRTIIFNILEDNLEQTRYFCENLIRGFLFVAAYSYAEAELKRWCEQIEKTRDDIFLKFKNIKASDQSIAKAEMYLRAVMGDNLPNLNEWGEWRKLKKCQELRNRFVHNQACLNPVDEELRKYITQHPHLSIREGKGLSGEDLVIFHKGFCEEVAEVVRIVLMRIMNYI